MLGRRDDVSRQVRDEFANSGLAHLSDLPSLRHLWLDRTQVTDAGLYDLGGLVNLSSLSLKSTLVTDSGVARLQRKLPALKVLR